MTFYFRKAGAAYKDGKLYLFERSSVLVMRGWPHPAAWEKTKEHPEWRHLRPHLRLDTFARKASPARDLKLAPPARVRRPRCEPDGQILLPFYSEVDVRPSQQQREALPYWRFLDSIPAEVRAQAGRFPARQWHVLSLLARVPGASSISSGSTPSFTKSWRSASATSSRPPLSQLPLTRRMRPLASSL